MTDAMTGAPEAWPRLAAERIRESYCEFAGLPEPEWQAFTESLRPWRVARQQPLLRRGEPCDWLAFLLRGSVRIRHVADDRWVNLGFDFEGRFVSDYPSFSSGEPSTVDIAALEDCDLVRLSRPKLQALYERDPAWERVGRRMAERELVRRWQKEQQIRSMTPAERYRRIVQGKPYLIRRVPQYELASFLGVSPETLSRIRARQGPRPRSAGRS